MNMPDLLSSRGFPFVDGAPLFLMTGEELATAMRFSGSHDSFRGWCRNLGIKAVPGRRNIFDPKHVRERLNAAQSMSPINEAAIAAKPISLVEERRARREQK